MPMGLFSPSAAASVLQGSWGVASVIVVEMLALGARLFFCLALAIFTCSLGPQLSLQPLCFTLGCFFFFFFVLRAFAAVSQMGPFHD